jgi:transcriptional regulator with XRE-family HTH domain
VDNRVEVREFLTSRRARVTPERAGLPTAGQRRVPGLRRSEVAALAGMSVEYYAKVERGSLAGVSAGVLDALARALQLDDAERAHLFDLAKAADGSSALLRPRRRSSKQWTPHRSLQWTLDAVTEGPAFVRNGRMDLLAENRLARAFYAQVYANPQRSANPRPVHLPRRQRAALLPRLGLRRRHLRRHPAQRLLKINWAGQPRHPLQPHPGPTRTTRCRPDAPPTFPQRQRLNALSPSFLNHPCLTDRDWVLGENELTGHGRSVG